MHVPFPSAAQNVTPRSLVVNRTEALSEVLRRAMRGPGESYSDGVLRLTEVEAGR
jgi:hypothetical protein